MLREIGQRVLRHAVRDARSWTDRLPGLTVAVNVSAGEAGCSTFGAGVIDALEQVGMRPGNLCLELTEGDVGALDPVAKAALEGLRRMGVQVPVDDFGTGQSSLAQLTNLPVDVVKIDRCFVADIADPRTGAVVDAVVTLARSLGLLTVAEGAETIDQLEAVALHGCDWVQGYLTGRPQTAKEISGLVEQWSVPAPPRRLPAGGAPYVGREPTTGASAVR